MLYISRRLDDYHYWVMDTDDGVETFITRDELFKCVRLFDLEIAGVEIASYDENKVIASRQQQYKAAVMPYQPNLSVAQLKAKTLYNVDIFTHEDTITFIGTNRDTKRGAKIRLSDFGSKMALDTDHRVVRGNTCVLIVDDKISVGNKSYIPGYGLSFAVFDITECHNDEIVAMIYKSFIHTIGGGTVDQVIDNPDRYDLWMGCISKLYSFEFDSDFVSPSMLSRVDEIEATLFGDFVDLVKYLESDNMEWESRMQDYEMPSPYHLERALMSKNAERLEELIHPVFSYLNAVLSGDRREMADVLENFLTYLKGSTKVHELYIRICEVVYRAIRK